MRRSSHSSRPSWCASAEAINRKPFQLIADLMQIGVFANVNQAVDEPTAKQLCAKNGFKFEAKKRQRDADAPPPFRKRNSN